MDYINKILDAGFTFINEEKKISSMKKYHLVCPNGHNIFSKLNNISERVSKRSSKGCSECHKEELNKQSLEVSKNHLPEGFKILGTYRKNVGRVSAKSIKFYQLECHKKHYFEKESGQLKNLRCTVCSEQIYIGQERTRKIFEILFKTNFPSIRPDWLKNPATKRNLELDGFNQELSIAFEFQGRQHFDANTQFYDDYDKQTKRDELKKELCKTFGVNLIEINQPTSYSHDKFVEQIFEQIKQQVDANKYPHVDFNIKKSDFNFKDIVFDNIRPNIKAFLEFCSNESPIKGYACIATDFHTYEDKITMCCPKGHSFDTTAAEFKRNVLGKKGRDIPCTICYAENNVVNTKIDLEYCIKEGEKYNLKLLSTEYKNVNEKLSWKKDSGQVIDLSFRQIQRSKTKVF